MNKFKSSNCHDGDALPCLNKFGTHKEHSIGFFTNINPKVTLRDNLRTTIQDLLMFIDLNDEESAPMIHQVKDSSGKETGQQKIVIPTFDLYSKEIGDGNGQERITTFAYEIRTSPSNANMLKKPIMQNLQRRKYQTTIHTLWNPFAIERGNNEKYYSPTQHVPTKHGNRTYYKHQRKRKRPNHATI